MDEHEFMSPTAATVRGERGSFKSTEDIFDLQVIQKDLRELQATLASPRDEFAGKLHEMNRETSEQLDRAREKFNAIETVWRENNFQKYLDEGVVANPQQLSQVDRKLAQAVREVIEMKRDAETALMELTKSVASVDSLIGKSNRLKNSSSTFRHKANIEKNSIPLSLKTQILLVAFISFVAYTVFKYLGC